PARQGRASGALPRARGSDAREARATARIPRRERALAGRRRAADRARLREAPREDQDTSRLRAAADRAAALAPASALPAGQRRPLRPRVRGVHALHLADPPLPRPARPPRDQRGAAEEALPAFRLELGGARRALVD